jgi:hypothetical protein
MIRLERELGKGDPSWKWNNMTGTVDNRFKLRIQGRGFDALTRELWRIRSNIYTKVSRETH